MSPNKGVLLLYFPAPRLKWKEITISHSLILQGVDMSDFDQYKAHVAVFVLEIICRLAHYFAEKVRIRKKKTHNNDLVITK